VCVCARLSPKLPTLRNRRTKGVFTFECVCECMCVCLSHELPTLRVRRPKGVFTFVCVCVCVPFPRTPDSPLSPLCGCVYVCVCVCVCMRAIPPERHYPTNKNESCLTYKKLTYKNESYFAYKKRAMSHSEAKSPKESRPCRLLRNCDYSILHLECCFIDIKSQMIISSLRLLHLESHFSDLKTQLIISFSCLFCHIPLTRDQLAISKLN